MTGRTAHRRPLPPLVEWGPATVRGLALGGYDADHWPTVLLDDPEDS